MEKQNILLLNLLVSVKTAIRSGDWKVDGRNDPETIIDQVETHLQEAGFTEAQRNGEGEAALEA